MPNVPAGYRHFHDELALLKQRLLDMSERAESLVALSVEALFERDRDKAIAVIEADEELDRLEVEAENQAIAMLALQQPMARDLRFLIGAIKVSSDLERVGEFGDVGGGIYPGADPVTRRAGVPVHRFGGFPEILEHVAQLGGFLKIELLR